MADPAGLMGKVVPVAHGAVAARVDPRDVILRVVVPAGQKAPVLVDPMVLKVAGLVDRTALVVPKVAGLVVLVVVLVVVLASFAAQGAEAPVDRGDVIEVRKADVAVLASGCEMFAWQQRCWKQPASLKRPTRFVNLASRFRRKKDAPKVARRAKALGPVDR